MGRPHSFQRRYIATSDCHSSYQQVDSGYLMWSAGHPPDIFCAPTSFEASKNSSTVSWQRMHAEAQHGASATMNGKLFHSGRTEQCDKRHTGVSTGFSFETRQIEYLNVYLCIVDGLSLCRNGSHHQKIWHKIIQSSNRSYDEASI